MEKKLSNKHTQKIRLSKFNTMIEEVRSWEKKDEIHTHTHTRYFNPTIK